MTFDGGGKAPSFQQGKSAILEEVSLRTHQGIGDQEMKCHFGGSLASSHLVWVKCHLA